MMRPVLLIHAILTLAAGIMLIVLPAQMPSSIGINVAREQYLICYLLGAAELAIGYLSFATRKLNDVKGLRVIALTFIIFHLATAAVELLAITQGASSMLWANIVVRVIVAMLFARFGL
jgi:hypothetical protein